MINKLPRDLVANILSRLHLGHLFRIRYVCKTWYTIVSNPLFFVIYFNPSPRTNTSTFVYHCNCDMDWETPLCLIQDSEKEKPLIFPVNRFKMLKFPLSLSFSKSCPLVSQSILMGSCNGLLCLSAVDVYPQGQGSSNIPRNPIYILNPITQGYQQLPELPTLHCNKVLSGFGFDVARNEFKVVLVLFHKGTKPNQVVIHTLGSSTWRSGTSHALEFLSEAFEVNSPAFLNGCLHWITMEPKKHAPSSSSKLLIVAFRVGLETFKTVSTPDTLGKFNTELECPLKHYGLAVLEGCLSLVDFSFEKFVHIWLMKKSNGSESWVKMVSIKRESVHCRSFLPITVRRNGEILLMCDDKYLVSYDTATNKWIPIKDVKNEKLWKSSIQVFPVDSSIISPKLACGVPQWC